MTAITQTLTNVTCKFCDAIAKFVKKVQYSRQMEANRRVARDLVSLGFEDQKEYRRLIDKMNDRTKNEYFGRF